MKYVAIILAGGKSSRMGSDKGLLKIGDKSMVEKSIEALKDNCQEISIIASNPEYDKFNVKRYEDEISNLGPLGGIQKGLRMSTQEWNVVLSTDIPNINKSIVSALIQTAIKEQIRVAKCNNRVHPLIGVYSKNILPKLDDFLLNGGRSVMEFLGTIETEYLDFDKKLENCFLNVNTSSEFEKLKVWK